MLRWLAVLAVLALPANALAQTAPGAARPAPPNKVTKPGSPSYARGHGNRTYQPAIVIDPNQYLQPPAPAPTKKPAHHVKPKKSSSGEDVFETHSTANQ